jgi:hypothetical protein
LSEYEKIQVSKPQLLAGNLLALAWILLGTVGCWLINPLYGALFLGFSAFAVYGIVRRMTCNSCYYCKSCTKGLAKTSVLFLGVTRIPGLGKGTIIALNAVIYVALTLIPVWIIFGVPNLSFEYILVLAGLAALTVVTLAGKFFYRAKKPQTQQ